MKTPELPKGWELYEANSDKKWAGMISVQIKDNCLFHLFSDGSDGYYAELCGGEPNPKTRDYHFNTLDEAVTAMATLYQMGVKA